jgi:hypothetical protein
MADAGRLIVTRGEVLSNHREGTRAVGAASSRSFDTTDVEPRIPTEVASIYLCCSRQNFGNSDEIVAELLTQGWTQADS